MRDEPLGDVSHAEQLELDALRWRAYGPDADILDDPPAVSRLRELEDRVRVERTAVEDAPVIGGDLRAGSEAPAGHAGVLVSDPAIRPPTARARRPRGQLQLVAGTALAAVLLGAVAWAGMPSPTARDDAGTDAIPLLATDDPPTSYRSYLDGLREEVLSLPGSEVIVDRIIRDQLRPYGILYGRTVASGPTVDHEFCMIIADLPASSIRCISAEDPEADPVSVELPAWYSDSESDLFTGLGPLVSYTLMPGGDVVAVLPDASRSTGTGGETRPTRPR